MIRTFLKSKIHQATVTGADINYEGSIGIDPGLCEKADLKEFYRVKMLLDLFAVFSKPGTGGLEIIKYDYR